MGQDRSRKGERTRNAILERVTPLFNAKGYAGSSVSEICAAAGVKKGGLYNHFASKHELARASFNWAGAQLAHALDQRMLACRATKSSVRLIHLVRSYCEMYEQDSFFPAGCPVLNTGIEAKGEYAALREPARNAVNKLHRRILHLAQTAYDAGEFNSEFNPAEFSDTVICQLEGAMFMSVLHDDSHFLHNAVKHIEKMVAINLS